MKKIYRKPVTKVIVIEDSLLNVTSPGGHEGEGQTPGQDQTNPTEVTLDLILWKREEEGYAD